MLGKLAIPIQEFHDMPSSKGPNKSSRLTTLIERIDGMLTRGAPLAEIKPVIASAHELSEAIEKENAKLIKNHEALKFQHGDLEERHFALEAKLAPSYLEPEQEAVLEAIAKTGGNVDATTIYKAVHKTASLEAAELIMILRELEEKKLILTDGIGQGTVWFMTHAGTRWLFNRRKLKG